MNERAGFIARHPCDRLGFVRRFTYPLAALCAVIALGCGSGASPADAGMDGGRRRDAGHDAGPLCEPATGLPDPLVCNGHAELCDRAYDAVSFPTTHNAMSSEQDDWVPPNQTYNMWRQLADGIRGFMIDTWDDDGVASLCHQFCELGSRPLVDALIELRMFLECHPAEVITLIIEAHIDEATTAAAFDAAGLLPYVDQQPLGTAWPTLREMITSGRRLVVFTESSEVSLPWYHYAYAYAWDNDYANRMPSDLNCDVNRGSGDNSIFILNHFLTAPFAMRSLAEMVNYDPFFLEQAQRCQTESGQLPNFPTVDFYDVGDLFEVVDTLNGFTP